MTKDGLLGSEFDLKPYEREDRTLDDAWVDAFLAHSAMRAVARMRRVREDDNHDESLAANSRNHRAKEIQ